jgi:TrmH family RNA methyltransferase
MSAGWREHCDVLLRIPMTGSASSLNAAVAGSVLLHEAMRRRAGG